MEHEQVHDKMTRERSRRADFSQWCQLRARSKHRIGLGGTQVKAKCLRPDWWSGSGEKGPTPAAQPRPGLSLDPRRHALVLRRTGGQKEGIWRGAITMLFRKKHLPTSHYWV